MYVFEETDSKTKYEARYWNPQSMNIAIVTSVTKMPTGIPFDWAAYIGAAPGACTEDEALKEAADRGAKLSEEDARYFFPNLKRVPYRH